MSSRHLGNTLVLAAMALLLLSSCARRVDLPRDLADIPGYHRAPPDLAGVDPTPLAGRRIVIDPGHGGVFRGAVGPDGLTEAEVNLGVALYLQGLLQWAGAEVALTRTADVDFLSPADSSLAADLAARVAVADRLRPDVFLSIHHNSTASRDPDINETQTYYPLNREGADRDLALAIHRQLVRALGITPARVMPGGFHVLRHSPAPAVLGEPAMISNPVMEGRLSLARSLELEARAYFLGLRDYFAVGSPDWWSDAADTVLVGPSGQPVTWRFESGGPGLPGLDPSSLRVTLSSRTLEPSAISADGQTLQVTVPAIDSPTVLLVTGRNLAGRVAQRRHWLRPEAPCADPSDRVVRDRLALEADTPLTWQEYPGRLPRLADGSGESCWPSPAPDLGIGQPTPALLPSLIGRHVALDPRGGGIDEQTRGPLGSRGSDVALEISQRLAALLRGLGCQVWLVRDDDLHTPDPTRVGRADRFGAELYLALGHGDPAVLHHPGSSLGTPWAQHLATALQPLLDDSLMVTPAYDYVLRHTACPAVLVRLPSLADLTREDHARTPAWQDAVARALLRGSVELLVPDTPWASPVEMVADLAPRAIPVDQLTVVRLDGNLVWLPTTGHAVAGTLASWAPGDPGLPAAGPHHVLELHAGPAWQCWALTRQPTGTWHGRIFLERR